MFVDARNLNFFGNKISFQEFEHTPAMLLTLVHI
jgi:hypothetical protein